MPNDEPLARKLRKLIVVIAGSLDPDETMDYSVSDPDSTF